MSLAGKVALITGGASGLGKHLAEALHAQGITLVIADINEEAGKSTVEELNKLREGSAHFFKTDVTEWDSQVSLFRSALRSVKRLDYVFANAGLLESTFLPHTPSSFSTEGEVEFVAPDMSTINVNTIGALYTSHLAAQVFRTQEVVDGVRGRIVVTASVASFTAIGFMPLYSTSKHSLVGFVRAFAQQLESENITVNAVAPNVTRSALAPKQIFDTVQDLGRLTPNDAVTSAFLSFLTGEDSTKTGIIKEVSMDRTFVRDVPAPVNVEVTENVNMLAGVHQAAYAPPPADAPAPSA